jgi:hypothetical protein
MIKKKESGDQAIDGKQPIQSQDWQRCARDISSLTLPIFENFIEARR